MLRIATMFVVTFTSVVTGQPLAERLAAVTDRAEFKHSRWGIVIVSSADGSVIYERNPDQLFVPASTAKICTCAAAMAEFGPEYRFKTKVVSDGLLVNKSLFGNVTLIASGDPTMGGRNKPDGTMAFVNSDHTYADPVSTSAGVTDTDPLMGLKDLARQIKNSGIDEIRGNVIIDDSLFEKSRSSGSGPDIVTPIVINDNVVDFIIRVGPAGAEVRVRPESKRFVIDSKIEISGTSPNVVVTAGEPWHYILRGNVPPSDKTYVQIAPVADPSALARALFIDCLLREGIVIDESAAAAQREGNSRMLAEHVSVPISELVKVTLKVSHNLYASMLPAIIAGKNGKRTMADGLAIEGKHLRQLGLNANLFSFAGGAGGSPADSITPRAMVELLARIKGRAEYSAIENGLPILGVDGTLAETVNAKSPARGQVRAKSGTLFWVDHANGRLLLRSKALAGVMTAKNGKNLIFAMFVNDVPLPSGGTPANVGAVLGQLCEIIYEVAP